MTNLLVDLGSVDSKTLATLAFLEAFGAKQSLLTYFADLSGPALRYLSRALGALSCKSRILNSWNASKMRWNVLGHI